LADNPKTSGVSALRKELGRLADADIARHSQRFFKTGEGQYGHGDRFLGIRVPVLRRLARTYSHLSIGQAANLLESRFHEERLLALILLVNIFKKAKDIMKEVGASFIVTGEVLGQRPMSQNKKSIDLIEKKSGLEFFFLLGYYFCIMDKVDKVYLKIRRNHETQKFGQKINAS